MAKLHKAYDFEVGDSDGSVVKITTVFVHGIAGNVENFGELFKFLKNDSGLNMRVVAFDLLGAGESPSGDELDFGYAGQIEALRESLEEIEGPVVLVGHSMGTMIVTKFAEMYPEKVSQLILISPPIYTEENLKSEEFRMAMGAFQGKVKAESFDKVKNEKAFEVETEDIVMNPGNYERLVKVKHPTTLIFGDKDQIIAAFNIPGVLKVNSLISAVKTEGGHGVSEKKFSAILDALRKASKAERDAK